MKIKILGSGAWEGIPASFCTCKICCDAKNNSSSKNYRTRPQFVVENSTGNFLIEASPDIRLQSSRFNLPMVKDFLISHWHFDHMVGLRDLHSWMKKMPQKPTIHCSVETEKMIKKEFNYLPLTVNVIQPQKAFFLFGIKITPLPVFHMFQDDNDIPDELIQNTFAYILESEGRKVAYLADYYKMPKATLEKLQNMDVVIADGTYLFTEQYKNAKANHLHGQEIINFTANLSAERVYYHSVSHLTGKTHDELQALLPPSHIITHDGMEII